MKFFMIEVMEMKKLLAFILIFVFTVLAVSSCGNSPESTQTPSESAEHSTPAADGTSSAPTESEPTEQNDPEPTHPTAKEVADETIGSFEDTIASLGSGASAREIALAIKANLKYVSDFDVNEAMYYRPGLDFSFSLDGISSVYYLMDNFSVNNNIIYLFDIEEGAVTDDIIKRIDESAELDFMYNDKPATVKVISKISTKDGDKVIFIMFDETVGMVDDGLVAKKPREVVDVFKEYMKNNPNASALDIASYIMNHQRVSQLYTSEREEGRLTGFFGEITGFAQCATFSPIMMPNTFIGYVFILDETADVGAFEEKLKDQADLAWNVCMSANTIITDNYGNVVLFMMCSEYNVE